MLAEQMIGAHSAALECMRRAAEIGQSFEVRDMNLRHAQKIMSIYTQQFAALDKHRGNNQQKITVERVNVASGGQAIVGNVETSERQKIASLENSKENGVDLEAVSEREKIKNAPT